MKKWKSAKPAAADAVGGFSSTDHLAGWIKSEARSNTINEQERVLLKAHDIVVYFKKRLPLRNVRKGNLRKLLRHRLGPNLSNAEADGIIVNTIGGDDLAFMSAGSVGRLFRLLATEWSSLQIATIHPYDLTLEQVREIQAAKRVAKKPERAKRRREARRRKKPDMKPRSEYLAEAARMKAAVAASGVSRATFYRRQKRNRETSMSPRK